MKKIERKRAREILSALDSKQIEKLSDNVSSNIVFLLSEIFSKDSSLIGQNVIGAYVPIQSEVRWFNCFDTNLNFGIAIPHVLDNFEMKYYQQKIEEVRNNVFGLKLEDSQRSLAVVPNVILVPALAFTKQGHRLGRGKGYFDRYLASFKGPKIGVGFECQVFESLTQQDFDIKMDYLVTEKNIYKGKNK